MSAQSGRRKRKRNSNEFELRETCGGGKISIKWKVNEYLSLNDQIESPTFLFSDANWHLLLFPDTYSIRYPDNEVSHLFLIRESTTSKQCVTCTFGIQKGGTEHEFHTREFVYAEGDKGIAVFEVNREDELPDELDSDGSLTFLVTARLYSVQEIKSFRSIQTLQGNFKDLLLSGRHCDVTIKVIDQEFPAHSLILAARSPVFSAMFDHDMEEKKSRIVNITDCDQETFKDFLSFIYTGNTDVVSPSNAVSLYKIADKYDLQDLKSTCVGCMEENLSVESFCDVILLAKMQNESELLTSLTDFFIKNKKTILPTSNWKSLKKEHFNISKELLAKKAKT